MTTTQTLTATPPADNNEMWKHLPVWLSGYLHKIVTDYTGTGEFGWTTAQLPEIEQKMLGWRKRIAAVRYDDTDGTWYVTWNWTEDGGTNGEKGYTRELRDSYYAELAAKRLP